MGGGPREPQLGYWAAHLIRRAPIPFREVSLLASYPGQNLVSEHTVRFQGKLLGPSNQKFSMCIYVSKT